MILDYKSKIYLKTDLFVPVLLKSKKKLNDTAIVLSMFVSFFFFSSQHELISFLTCTKCLDFPKSFTHVVRRCFGL